MEDQQETIHFEPWTDRISLTRFEAINASDIRRIIDDQINSPSFDLGATEVGVRDDDLSDAEMNVTESDGWAKVTEASSESEIGVPAHIEEDGSRPVISGDVVEEESFEEEDGDEDDAQEEMNSDGDNDLDDIERTIPDRLINFQPIVQIKRKQHAYDDPHVTEPIFQRFACDSEMPSYRDLEKQSGIPHTTISNWHLKFKQDPTWRPSKRSQSKNRRIFGDSEVEQIAQQLDEEYISRQRPLTFNIFQKVIMDHVLLDMEPHSDGTMSAPPHRVGFKCSRRFMESFLKRNHMSNRVCTAQRRPEIDQTEVDAFHALINEALNDPSDKIILNADESHWKVLMPPKRSIAFTRQDSVKLDIDRDRKAGFTNLAT